MGKENLTQGEKKSLVGLKKRIRKQKQMYISLEGSRRKESKRLLGQKRGQMDGGSRPRGRLFKYRRGGNGDGQEIRKRHSHKNSHNRGCLWAPVELERLEIGRKSSASRGRKKREGECFHFFKTDMRRDGGAGQ
jgi:hypothetical protein